MNTVVQRKEELSKGNYILHPEQARLLGQHLGWAIG